MACIHPTIQLNGSGRGHLLAQRAEQWQAIDQAIRTLCKTAPHARDFYAEPGAWSKAEAEHERRLAFLHELLTSIETEHATLIQGAHDGK